METLSTDVWRYNIWGVWVFYAGYLFDQVQGDEAAFKKAVEEALAPYGVKQNQLLYFHSQELHGYTNYPALRSQKMVIVIKNLY